MASTMADHRFINLWANSQPNSRIGVSFIVSNDYSAQQAHQRGLKVLDGTHRDAEKMSEAFNKLGYEVVSRRDLTLPDLIDFVNKAAARPYDPSYKRLVFVFSGHGNCNGEIYSQEGNVLKVEEIISQFKPDKHPHFGRMARLFFFDACRGDTVDHGVELTTRSVSRGGGFLSPDRVPTHGNILVAYSTLPFHESYELYSGGVWMGLLSEAIQSQNDDITVVLTDVSSKLTQMCTADPRFQNPQKFQTPQCINQLVERVNFLAESSQIGRSIIQPPRKAASKPTHTPPGFPPTHKSQSSLQKTPVSKLHEYCQQNELKVPEYKESPTRYGFRYTVTVKGKSYTGVVKPRKQEAKQSAAEVANKQVASSVCGRGSTAISVSYVKVLKERYFDKNQIKFKKEYFVTTVTKAGSYQCTLTIPGVSTISGEIAPSKSAAENNAAKSAMKFLKLL